MVIFSKIVNKITSIVAVVSYVGFLGIMFLTVVDILMRLITNNSVLGAYEIVERAMICAVFASFAYTQSEHGHVQITLVIQKFPRRIQFLLMTLNNLLSVVASVMVAYAAFNQAKIAYSSNYTTGVLLIPTYPFYYVEIVAMFVLALAFLLDAVKCAIGIVRPDMEKEIQKTWS